MLAVQIIIALLVILAIVGTLRSIAEERYGRALIPVLCVTALLWVAFNI